MSDSHSPSRAHYCDGLCALEVEAWNTDGRRPIMVVYEVDRMFLPQMHTTIDGRLLMELRMESK